jgi:CRISPR-associated protein Cmr1
MKPMTLNVELTTPGFLGGANPVEDCEWRAASVRGQLRWWFRAVAGGRFQGDLGQVRTAEEEVFGSTDRGSALRVRLAGKGRVLEGRECGSWGERVDSARLGTIWKIGEGEEPKEETTERLKLDSAVNPIHYLAGPGCIWKNKLNRPCFAAESQAELSLSLRPGRRLPADLDDLLRHTLLAWLHLGGLGARSRRGFGSLAVKTEDAEESLEEPSFVEPPATHDELIDRLRLFLELGRESTAMAEWSHFSSATRICLSPRSFPTWKEAMVHAGAWLMAFRRRYGRFTDRDYHWAKEAKHNKQPRGVPDRAAFGLPLPFGKPDKEIVGWGPQRSDHRRASPLLLHIAKLEEGEDGEFRYVPVFTHLPARLVPAGEDVRFQGLHKPAGPPTPQQREIVTRFLDDLISKDLVEGVEP